MPNLIKSSKGFTLIELLVVITIIGIITTVVFINYRSTSSDQVLKKAAGEIQSFLRLAQSNATAGVKCGTQGGAYWGVKFESSTQMKLRCGPTGVENDQKTLDLVGVQLSYSCPLSSQLIVTYAPLSGAVNMGNCSVVTITLTATKDSRQKNFIITRGGSVDAQ